LPCWWINEEIISEQFRSRGHSLCHEPNVHSTHIYDCLLIKPVMYAQIHHKINPRHSIWIVRISSKNLSVVACLLIVVVVNFICDLHSSFFYTIKTNLPIIFPQIQTGQQELTFFIGC
jgi:hypothetical protein